MFFKAMFAVLAMVGISESAGIPPTVIERSALEQPCNLVDGGKPMKATQII